MKTTRLPEALAERIRDLRTSSGKRQEDLALTARLVGLNWTQTTVSAIEQGQRELSAEELLLLPLAFAAMGRRAELSDIVPAAGDFTLSSGQAATGEMFANVVRAKAFEHFQERIPGDSALLLLMNASIADSMCGKWDTENQSQKFADVKSAAIQRWLKGVAERKAAKALRISAERVVSLSFQRWRRTLTAERDLRVSKKAPAGASPRVIQALRGHETRLLLEELRSELGGRRRMKRGKRRSRSATGVAPVLWTPDRLGG